MTKDSPQVYARAGGLLYLLIFVMAGLSMVFQSKIVVSGNAAATAAHIGTSLLSWRISVASELVMFTCDIPLAVIFYILLRPVNSNLALIAAFFRFAEAAIGSTMATLHVVPILTLPASPDIAFLAIRLYNYGFGIALVPFGLHCALLGYLIYRSTYLPKTFGVLMTIAGVCYVINSFALIIAPAAASVTFLAMLISGFPAELGLCLWLLICGVNVPRWNAAIAASSAR